MESALNWVLNSAPKSAKFSADCDADFGAELGSDLPPKPMLKSILNATPSLMLISALQNLRYN